MYLRADQPGDMVAAIFGGDERRAELVFSQWKTGGPTLFYKVLGGKLSEAEFDERRFEPRVWIQRVRPRVWYFAPGSAGGRHEEHWRAEGYLAGNVSPGGRTTSCSGSRPT